MGSEDKYTTSITVDGEQLLQQIEQLGKIGYESPELGRTRIALTDNEKMGRDLVVSWMNELDLEVTIDQVGNIFGTMPDISGNTTNNVVMIGSHIDTVTNAGALDGCYGVLSGLAVIRAFKSAGILPNNPITVAAFTNEEGIRYQPDMMGSLAYAGGIDVETVLNTIGTDGTKLGDELSRIGYAGSKPTGYIIPKYYLELHVEQGPVLESEQLEIGVVTHLQGISWQKLQVTGKANHAGTTPMHLRSDAGVAAAEIITFLRNYTQKHPTTLATVGSLNITPNVINVIPRFAELSVDIRDPDEQRLQQAEQALAEFLPSLEKQEGVTITSEVLARFEPVTFDRYLTDTIETATKIKRLPYRHMTSGAGHDAQMISRIAPAAMIFVPSKDGVSHNPAEHTDNIQLIQGTEVLLKTLQQIMSV